MAPQNLRVLMQEHPIKLVERVTRLMRIPASGIGGTFCRRRSRPSRSNVRIADAFAEPQHAQRWAENAPAGAIRRSSAGRKSPLLRSDGGVISSVAFSTPTHAAVFVAGDSQSRPSPSGGHSSVAED
jgi:hypothetical protein